MPKLATDCDGPGLHEWCVGLAYHLWGPGLVHHCVFVFGAKEDLTKEGAKARRASCRVAFSVIAALQSFLLDMILSSPQRQFGRAVVSCLGLLSLASHVPVTAVSAAPSAAPSSAEWHIHHGHGFDVRMRQTSPELCAGEPGLSGYVDWGMLESHISISGTIR